MTDQDEAPQQTSQQEGTNQQLGDIFRLDLVELEQSRGVKSDESEPDTGSTIYDPAIIELSPRYQKIVEERQKRGSSQEDQADQFEGLFHISSPAARKPGETNVGEPQIRLPAEDEEEKSHEQQERLLCCHGLVPLLPSMIVFNVLNMVIGFVCIGIGASQFGYGSKDMVGFGSAGRLVITGSFLLVIFSIVLGGLFILCGILGTLVNLAKAYRSRKLGKLPNLIYHCLFFLVTIICTIILGLNLYSVIVRQSGPIYDTEFWKDLVQSDSRHLCNLERELNCAAMSLDQCLSDRNETRHTFCPGHFCVDFCRIADEDVSLQPICTACRTDPLESIPAFVECQRLEKIRSAVQTCEGLPDEVLDNIYGKLLTIAVIGFVWILVVWSVIAYVECLL